jgi:hypothetical protein
MTITAVPYGQFLRDLVNGGTDVSSDTHYAALLTDAYALDQAAHTQLSDVQAWELASDADPDGYQTGGKLLPTNGNPVYNAAAATVTYNVNAISWAKLTGTVRYVVIYNGTNSLRGLYDLGAATTYTAQPLQLTFTNGLLRFAPGS